MSPSSLSRKQTDLETTVYWHFKFAVYIVGTCPPRSRDSQGQAATQEEEEERSVSSETEQSEYSAHQNATLFMLQFAIEQMSLEVRSRTVLAKEKIPVFIG